MNILKKLGIAASVAVLLAASVGCTRHVSRDISAEGEAGEVIFPSLDKLVLKEGTFPTKEALGQVGAGITKDQLYQLLGSPHFREGLFGVNEWDYLFHFREGGEVVTCQYKVIFDKDYHGQSFHWMPEDCAERIAPKAPPAQAVQQQVKRFDLSGDALFAFGRSGRDDILPGGREKLAEIAAELRGSDSLVRVIGHTDFIGDERSNQRLSQQRADSVRAVLVENGLPAESVSSTGMGESTPVKVCDQSLPRTSLVACLQPNRRVEIVATGLRVN